MCSERDVVSYEEVRVRERGQKRKPFPVLEVKLFGIQGRNYLTIQQIGKDKIFIYLGDERLETNINALTELGCNIFKLIMESVKG